MRWSSDLARKYWRICTLTVALCFTTPAGATHQRIVPIALEAAQQTASPSQAPAKPPAADSSAKDKSKAETHITPQQAQQLFALVDQLLKFSSDETGLPIKSEVKRQMTTRNAVESYLSEKFNEDEDAKRMQRSEIVLKKFGLLDRYFDLKPFLLSLLKEQI